MIFFLDKAGKLERKTAFPVKVSRVYSCDWRNFPVLPQDYIHQQYSIILRYDSDSRLCTDRINGQVMGIPFPNAVFKIPGMKIRITEDSPRSAIGFSYSSEVIELLRSWEMLPKKPFLPLSLNAELKRLIGEFNKFTRTYLTLNAPGDWIDSICFDILREIMRSQQECQLKNRIPEIRIREVELYFQHNFDKKLDLDAVAEMFNFSHTSFYQYWKNTYHITPHQYIEKLKLRAAAFRLLQSKEPLSLIAEELQFPKTSIFYRKFREYFHTTPAEFRKNRDHWKKVLSESSME